MKIFKIFIKKYKLFLKNKKFEIIFYNKFKNLLYLVLIMTKK